MMRSLDEIADDIRDATKMYEGYAGQMAGHREQIGRLGHLADEQSDLMDKYRDELLEAVNSR